MNRPRGEAHERQAVGLGPRVRLLVRANAPGLVALGGHGGEHPAAREPLPRGEREILRQDIQCRSSVATQHAVTTPRRQSFRRVAVALVLRLPRRRFRQHDVHDIVPVERCIPRPFRRIDDIVRRSDQDTEPVSGRIPLTLKGRDEVSHELS